LPVFTHKPVVLAISRHATFPSNVSGTGRCVMHEPCTQRPPSLPAVRAKPGSGRRCWKGKKRNTTFIITT